MKIRELNECENCGKPKAKHVGYDWNCPVLPEEKLMDFLASAATTIFVPIRVVECKGVLDIPNSVTNRYSCRGVRRERGN